MSAAPTTPTTRRAPTARSWALVAVGVLGVTLSGPIGSATAAAPLAVAFWRSAGGAVATAPVVLLRRRQELRGLDAAVLRRSVLSGVLLAAHLGFWIPSLRLTSVAVSTALVATTPVWTVLLHRLAGHRVPLGVVAGVALALAGILLITGVDAGRSTSALVGDLLALAGGMLGAGYTVVGEAVRRTTSTPTYTLLAYASCALLLVPLCLLGGQPLGGYALRTWVELAVLTVAAQLLGHTLLNAALPEVGATALSLAILFEVPGASLVAWAWLAQRPPLGVLPGALAVLGGLVLVVRSGQAEATDPP